MFEGPPAPRLAAKRARTRAALYRLGLVERGPRGPLLTAAGRKALEARAPRRWADAEAAALRAMRAAAVPHAIVAEALGRGVDAVKTRACNSYAVSFHVTNRLRLKPRDLAAIRAARAEGTEWAALAERFGSPVATFRNNVRRAANFSNRNV